MKEEEFIKILEKNHLEKGIYWVVDSEGNVCLDSECMREELEDTIKMLEEALK